MNTIEVTGQVWVAARSEAWPARPHPSDAMLAETMAGWRAREFLAARGLLRDLLAEIEPAASGANVVLGTNGQPGMAGWPELGVSVSHDGGSVAACVGLGRSVGVDVQRPPDRLNEAMVRRCLRCHAESLSSLQVAERALEFAWVWTAQEACVKAEGTGLAGCPWTIDVPPRHTTGSWRGFRWRSLRELSEIPLSCAWQEAS
jgi:4'-phosphopantetheinyl transferase